MILNKFICSVSQQMFELQHSGRGDGLLHEPISIFNSCYHMSVIAPKRAYGKNAPTVHKNSFLHAGGQVQTFKWGVHSIFCSHVHPQLPN